MNINPTLYFLRSSEQHIVNTMLTFAFCLDEQNQSAKDFEELDIYKTFYGLTRKDLGLYALVDDQVAGAVWIRNLQDDPYATLNIAVKPEFRSKGIATAMLNQVFLEAGEIFETICVKIHNEDKIVSFYEKFGFKIEKNLHVKSLISDKNLIVMIKDLEKKELNSIYDDYGNCKWMEP